MTRAGALVGSLVFMVGMPGVMGVLLPYWLTGWDGQGAPLALRIVGTALLVVGGGVLVNTVIRFAIEGLGTPFPAAPTENLVMGGLYRYVRNPMYLAVTAIILGQAAVLGRPVLVAYAVAFGATVWSFVHWYEEPALRRQFGTEYEDYLRTVPGWLPRRPRRPRLD